MSLYDAITTDDVFAIVLNGGNVRSLDQHGRSPLHRAKTAASMSALLEYGADVLARDLEGNTPLHLQASRSSDDWNKWDSDVARLMVLIRAGGDVNARNASGQIPLHMAMGTHMVQALVSARSDVSAVDNIGRTFLHVNPGMYSVPAVRHAIFQGTIDVHAVDNFSRTLLHHEGANWYSASFYIGMGVDLHKRDNLGRTPLAMSMSEPYTHSLLFHGANVDSQDIFGRTALMGLASRVGTVRGRMWALGIFMRIVKVILQRRPDTTLTDCDGLTAMDLCTHQFVKEKILRYHTSKYMNFRRRRTILVILRRVRLGLLAMDTGVGVVDHSTDCVIRGLARLDDASIIRLIMEFV